MEIFRSFLKKLVDGMVDLPGAPLETIKRAVTADIVIKYEGPGLVVKLVLTDGTDFMFQKVSVFDPGNTITLKGAKIITEFTIT